MTKLILINFDVIFKDKTHVRDGVFDFLERYKSKRIALLSYENRNLTTSALKITGLFNKIERIYSQENMGCVKIPNSDGYYPQPMLIAWIRADFDINEKDAIVISNSYFDKIATEWYNIKMIEVPSPEKTFKLDISIDSWYNKLIFFNKQIQNKPLRIGYA